MDKGEEEKRINRGRIFSCERPFYERAVSDLDPQRYMHRPVKVAHSSFIDWSHTTKNTASGDQKLTILTPNSDIVRILRSIVKDSWVVTQCGRCRFDIEYLKLQIAAHLVNKTYKTQTNMTKLRKESVIIFQLAVMVAVKLAQKLHLIWYNLSFLH